jgi:hypothetical protein
VDIVQGEESAMLSWVTELLRAKPIQIRSRSLRRDMLFLAISAAPIPTARLSVELPGIFEERDDFPVLWHIASLGH